MRCYISGPITGQDNAREDFKRIATQLEDAGFTSVNPFDLHGGKELENTWEKNMKEDIAELIKCESIFMMCGWKTSKGARLELYIAQSLGIKVMYETPAEKGKLKQIELF